MGPEFGVCALVLVILSRGCTLIRGLRLMVFDLDCKKRWYLTTIEGLCESTERVKMRESQTFDIDSI